MDNTGFEAEVTQVEEGSISAGLYNLLIGACLCWGFAINWLMVKCIPYESVEQINIQVFLVGYSICCIVGAYLFNHSSSPPMSFLGYNLVVVPFGLTTNLVVHQYDSAIVLDAIQITGVVTFIMMILGSMFPAFFQRSMVVLVTTLSVVIIVEICARSIFGTHNDIIDWIVVLVFCGFIGFQWGAAQEKPKTVDNAIDSAAALYMDIINLFLRILRVLGRRRKGWSFYSKP